MPKFWSRVKLHVGGLALARCIEYRIAILVWWCQLGLASTYLLDRCWPASGSQSSGSLRSTGNGLLSPVRQYHYQECMGCSVPFASTTTKNAWVAQSRSPVPLPRMHGLLSPVRQYHYQSLSFSRTPIPTLIIYLLTLESRPKRHPCTLAATLT